ncbi:MAG: calcium/sodium antiporter [Tidjanibacter sp.]|nr:calcium/sodium antiporter [Tidjanibacter sp.]
MFILQLLLGAVLLSVGANFLTDGASAIAKRLHVSEFLIGVTIVAVGTSMPEFVVSVMSAIGGQSDVSIGNVVGSNIFNIYAILGITTIIAPLALTRENIRRDIPICLGVSVLLCLLALDGSLWGGESNILSRVDGIVLLLLYGLFLWFMIRSGKNQPNIQPTSESAQEPQSTTKEHPMWLAIVMVIGGLGGLVWGSDLFLDGAITLARKVGLSEAVIGIVLVAAGTSLPEFFASFISALKGKTDIAIGNILGSNIANILLILGTSATITPLQLGGITSTDLLVMLSAVVAILISMLTFGRKRIDRIEGVSFFVIYVLYTLWLLNI